MKAMKKMGLCALMTASVFALSGVAMGEGQDAACNQLTEDERMYINERKDGDANWSHVLNRIYQSLKAGYDMALVSFDAEELSYCNEGSKYVVKRMGKVVAEVCGSKLKKEDVLVAWHYLEQPYDPELRPLGVNKYSEPKLIYVLGNMIKEKDGAKYMNEPFIYSHEKYADAVKKVVSEHPQLLK